MIKKDGTVLFEDSGEKKKTRLRTGHHSQPTEATSKFIKGRPEIDLELARGIVACVKTGNVDGGSLATMLQHYEEGMFSRSKKEAAKTESAMHNHFQEGGGERMLEIIGGGAQPEDLVFD